MTTVIKDLQRLLQCVGRVGKETLFLKTRYTELLPVATANLQAEYLTSLRRASSAKDDRVLQLQNELYVDDATSSEQVLGKTRR